MPGKTNWNLLWSKNTWHTEPIICSSATFSPYRYNIIDVEGSRGPKFCFCTSFPSFKFCDEVWNYIRTKGGGTLTTKKHVIWLLAVNFQIWYEILGYIKIFQTYFNGQHTLIHIMWQGKATLKTLHINSKVCFIYLLSKFTFWVPPLRLEQGGIIWIFRSKFNI